MKKLTLVAVVLLLLLATSAFAQDKSLADFPWAIQEITVPFQENCFFMGDPYTHIFDLIAATDLDAAMEEAKTAHINLDDTRISKQLTEALRAYLYWNRGYTIVSVTPFKVDSSQGWSVSYYILWQKQ